MQPQRVDRVVSSPRWRVRPKCTLGGRIDADGGGSVNDGNGGCRGRQRDDPPGRPGQVMEHLADVATIFRRGGGEWRGATGMNDRLHAGGRQHQIVMVPAEQDRLEQDGEASKDRDPAARGAMGLLVHGFSVIWAPVFNQQMPGANPNWSISVAQVACASYFRPQSNRASAATDARRCVRAAARLQRAHLAIPLAGPVAH